MLVCLCSSPERDVQRGRADPGEDRRRGVGHLPPPRQRNAGVPGGTSSWFSPSSHKDAEFQIFSLSLSLCPGPGLRSHQRLPGPHHRGEAAAAQQALGAVRPDARVQPGHGPGGGQLEPPGGQTHPHAAAERALPQRGHGPPPGRGAAGPDQGSALQRPGGPQTRSGSAFCSSTPPAGFPAAAHICFFFPIFQSCLSSWRDSW